MQSNTLHDKSAAAGCARWGHLAKICTAVRNKRAGTLSIILRTASKFLFCAWSLRSTDGFACGPLVPEWVITCTDYSSLILHLPEEVVLFNLITATTKIGHVLWVLNFESLYASHRYDLLVLLELMIFRSNDSPPLPSRSSPCIILVSLHRYCPSHCFLLPPSHRPFSSMRWKSGCTSFALACRLGHLIWGPILCETVQLTPGENSHRQLMPSIMIQNDATTSNSRKIECWDDQDALESLW